MERQSHVAGSGVDYNGHIRIFMEIYVFEIRDVFGQMRGYGREIDPKSGFAFPFPVFSM